jgi:dTDP-4-amino-4,6-dideoxygalactose transaminase
MSSNKDISEVPFLDLKAQYSNIQQEIQSAINGVVESQYFIMGPEVSSFEEQMADYCNVSYAVSCASGSDALLLSLMALDIGRGDAVITTPYTFFATAGAIAHLGATPVFLDIRPDSYNLDPDQVEKFLSDNHPLNKELQVKRKDVKAVIPVHLYGQPTDMDPIMELAQQNNIAVIEDAAQAIGAEYKNRSVGSIGEFGCFSFFPSKNLGGYGDGGLITTNDDHMAEKLAKLRLHGAKPKYHHSIVGINSRLDALQAAILKVKLKYLDEWSQARREKALFYNQLFKEADLAADTDRLNVLYRQENGPTLGNKSTKIVLPQEIQGTPNRGGRHIYHQYIIRTDFRSEIMEALKAHNIGYSVYYPLPLHEQECFAYLGYESDDCPVAHHASETTLALPVYPELCGQEQRYVVDTIRETLKNL